MILNFMSFSWYSGTEEVISLLKILNEITQTKLIDLMNYGMNEFIELMIELMELNIESSELLKCLECLICVGVNLVASV